MEPGASDHSMVGAMEAQHGWGGQGELKSLGQWPESQGLPVAACFPFPGRYDISDFGDTPWKELGVWCKVGGVY